MSKSKAKANQGLAKNTETSDAKAVSKINPIIVLIYQSIIIEYR